MVGYIEAKIYTLWPLDNHLVKLQIVIAILWWVHITQAIKCPSAHWIECEDSKRHSGPLWASIRMLGSSIQAFNRELERDTWSDWTSRSSGSRLWYFENMTYTAVKQLLLWNLTNSSAPLARRAMRVKGQSVASW